MGLSLGVGELLVREARRVIELYVLKGERAPIAAQLPELEQRRGAFVSLYALQGGRRALRGCMGLPEPEGPLREALALAALSACRDPRFEPLRAEELSNVVLEVSVLTPFRQLQGRPLSFPELIRVGVHGLFVAQGPFQGLLLPQVAVEERWDAEDFLCNACMKAGLPPDAWLTGARVYIFGADVFAEESPGGPVRSLMRAEEPLTPGEVGPRGHE